METPAYLRIKFGEEVRHDEPEEGKERDFFNRVDAYRKALTILRSLNTHRAVWLVGERRAGKTSLLKLLLSKCKKEGAIAIEVPWQFTHSSEDFCKEFLHILNQNIQRQSTVNALESSFWQVLEEYLRAMGWPWLVIGVDELDSILLEQVDERSRKEILGILIRLVTEVPNVKVVIASTRPANKIELIRTSPLVSKSEEIYLAPFEQRDLEEMLQALAPDLSKEEVYEVHKLSGGWPYYAKALLYNLLQMPPDTPQRLERARRQAIESISPTCDHLYRYHWDDNEKQGLWLMVNKQEVKSDEVKVLDASLQTALRELARRGYLLEIDGGYRFRVILIADWLQTWTRREVEQEDLQIPSLLKKIEQTVAWSKEPKEQFIQITRETLRKRGLPD